VVHNGSSNESYCIGERTSLEPLALISIWKDVECTFGILKGRFCILKTGIGSRELKLQIKFGKLTTQLVAGSGWVGWRMGGKHLFV
jgi:hypothetical protein